MTDLPGRILAAIEQTEQRARFLDEHLNGHDRPWNLDDPTDPAVVLRHCEADKRTVERHLPGLGILVAKGVERHVCVYCDRLLPCPDLLDRALAYGEAIDPATED